MTLNTLCPVALALIVTISSGCTSTGAVTQPHDSSHAQANGEPVYIMPTCQTIGRETTCQWINQEPDSETAGGSQMQVVEGIAL